MTGTVKYVEFSSHINKQEAVNINGNQKIHIRPEVSKSGGKVHWYKCNIK